MSGSLVLLHCPLVGVVAARSPSPPPRRLSASPRVPDPSGRVSSDPEPTTSSMVGPLAGPLDPLDPLICLSSGAVATRSPFPLPLPEWVRLAPPCPLSAPPRTTAPSGRVTPAPEPTTMSMVGPLAGPLCPLGLLVRLSSGAVSIAIATGCGWASPGAGGLSALSLAASAAASAALKGSLSVLASRFRFRHRGFGTPPVRRSAALALVALLLRFCRSRSSASMAATTAAVPTTPPLARRCAFMSFRCLAVARARRDRYSSASARMVLTACTSSVPNRVPLRTSWSKPCPPASKAPAPTMLASPGKWPCVSPWSSVAALGVR